MAREFFDAKGSMFLGRGNSFPVALEGAQNQFQDLNAEVKAMICGGMRPELVSHQPPFQGSAVSRIHQVQISSKLTYYKLSYISTQRSIRQK